MKSALPAQNRAVREFNRFYTRLLGFLGDTLLGSVVTLAEARVLWEINARPGCRAEELVADLGVDRGYLSRLLRRLETRGYLRRALQASDRRVRPLSLTPRGRSFLARLDTQANRQIEALLAPLSAADRRRLVEAMGTVQALLSPRSA